MGRPRAGARWFKEKGRVGKNGKIGPATWRIRDYVDGKTAFVGKSLSADAPDVEREKDRMMEEYLAQKRAGANAVIKNQSTHEAAIADVIALYVKERVRWDPHGKYEAPVSRPNEVRARLLAVLEFFGDHTVDYISTSSVSAFSRFIEDRAVERERLKLTTLVEKQRAKRRTRQTLAKLKEVEKRLYDFEHSLIEEKTKKSRACRRYLDDLQAALNHAHDEGMLTHPVKVPKPGKYKPRSKHFEWLDIKRMLYTATTYRGLSWQDGQPVRNGKGLRHVARYILVASHTGARSSTIWRATFERRPDHPWIELKQVKVNGKRQWIGYFHKVGEEEIEYENKPAPMVEIPQRLVKYLVWWKKIGLVGPCDYNGEVADPAGALKRCMDITFGEGHGYVGHTFRHTVATLLMRDTQSPVADIASFIGFSVEVMIRVYGRHRRTEHKAIGQAFSARLAS